jgi:hypothetical protein
MMLQSDNDTLQKQFVWQSNKVYEASVCVLNLRRPRDLQPVN